MTTFVDMLFNNGRSFIRQGPKCRNNCSFAKHNRLTAVGWKGRSTEFFNEE